MILLRLALLRRRQPHRLAQTGLRSAELPEQLPGGAEVGGNVEVTGVLALGGAEDLDGAIELAETDVEGAEVGRFVGAERAAACRLFHVVGGFLIALAQRSGRQQ